MLRRTGHRRAAFTLIELLVVIAIIAVLLSLTVAASMKMLGLGPKADTQSRLSTLGNVIDTFNQDSRFGSPKYIPAGQVDLNPYLPNGSPKPNFQTGIRAFPLENTYPDVTNPNDPNELNVNCFEAVYIARLFPRANLKDLGNPAIKGARLDANQTLLFFLGGIPVSDANGAIFTGFSNDAGRPFSPQKSTDESRKKSGLEMSAGRYALDASGFPRLLDGYRQPFFYYSAYIGKEGRMSGWNPGGPQPYTNGTKFVNDGKYQLISAGADKQPGPGGDWATSGATLTGKDDMANFSPNLLGAGP